MRIILSPAKKMRVDVDDMEPVSTPVFLSETEEILRWLRGLSFAELKKLWNCNEKIARENYERLQDMDLHDPSMLTPAVLSYDGIAYQYMASVVFENSHFSYVQEHLRILSGFYGVLKAMDGVVPYRLEMQAKAKIGGTGNLYEYWGDRIYREVIDDSHVIINLASKEYSVCVEKYLKPEDTFITCFFGEYADAGKQKIVQKGVYAKMARGEMVRFMAEHQIENLEEMKAFDRLGYRFCPDQSTEREFVFIKQ